MSPEWHKAYYQANKAAQLEKQRLARAQRTPEEREAEREYQKRYREQNRERLLAYDRERNAERWEALSPEKKAEYLRRQREADRNDPERRRAINARAIAKNKEQRLQAWREWYEANKAYNIARVSARRAHILNATPLWANLEAIKRVYAQAVELEKQDGVKRHVDHIVPIKGKHVSGLHVESNLQILPASENLRKSNRHERV